MKHYLLVFLSLFSFLSFGQVPITLELSQRLSEVDDSELIPVLIKGEKEAIEQYLGTVNSKSTPRSISQNYYRTQLSKTQIESSKDFKNLLIAGGIKGQPLNDSVRVLNHAVEVHQGLEGLGQSYKGKGVLIAIFDTGIDYRHPDFQDENGKTRIYRIWDQSKNGNNPSGFNYGYECDSISINEGRCPAYDERWPYLYGLPHGTHVAGIAAGKDNLTGLYTGMAPEATIVGVALDFNNFGTAIVDATQYVLALGKELNMPVVINLSAGSYAGSHDGIDPITQATEELIENYELGAMFVSSAGNGGNNLFHVRHELTNQQQVTLFTNIPNQDTFVVPFYVDAGENLDFNFQLMGVKRGDFSVFGRSEWYNMSTDFNFQSDGVLSKSEEIFANDGTKLGNLSLFVERYESHYGVYVYIVNSNRRQYFWGISTKGSGIMDAYSHQNLTGTSTFRPLRTISPDFPYYDQYVEADKEQTIVGYWTASSKFLTVGNYMSKKVISGLNGYSQVNPGARLAINPNSSKGPTRDGRIKPDVSSTGTRVASAMNLDFLDLMIRNNDPDALYRITLDSLHFYVGGTSMASPAVAGGVALLLERYPNLSTKDIVESVRQNAYRDVYTTSNENNVYGFGKFSALNSIKNPWIYGCMDSEAENYSEMATIDNGSCVFIGCTNPNAVNYWSKANQDDGTCYIPDEGDDFYFKIAPNPITDVAKLVFGFKDNYENTRIEIYNELGQLVLTRNLNQQLGQLSINRAQLNWSGKIYYVQLRRDSDILTTEILVVQ